MVDMVRREHRYTHVISTKVSLGMSTDKGRHPKSALHEANADCRMRNVQSKTTVFSIFTNLSLFRVSKNICSRQLALEQRWTELYEEVKQMKVKEIVKCCT